MNVIAKVLGIEKKRYPAPVVTSLYTAATQRLDRMWVIQIPSLPGKGASSKADKKRLDDLLAALKRLGQQLLTKTQQWGGSTFMVMNFTGVRVDDVFREAQIFTPPDAQRTEDLFFLADVCEFMHRWLSSGNTLVLLTQSGRALSEGSMGSAHCSVSDPAALIAAAYLLWVDASVSTGRQALSLLRDSLDIAPAPEYQPSADRYLWLLSQLVSLDEETPLPCRFRVGLTSIKLCNMPRWAHQDVSYVLDIETQCDAEPLQLDEAAIQFSPSGDAEVTLNLPLFGDFCITFTSYIPDPSTHRCHMHHVFRFVFSTLFLPNPAVKVSKRTLDFAVVNPNVPDAFDDEVGGMSVQLDFEPFDRSSATEDFRAKDEEAIEQLMQRVSHAPRNAQVYEEYDEVNVWWEEEWRYGVILCVEPSGLYTVEVEGTHTVPGIHSELLSPRERTQYTYEEEDYLGGTQKFGGTWKSGGEEGGGVGWEAPYYKDDDWLWCVDRHNTLKEVSQVLQEFREKFGLVVDSDFQERREERQEETQASFACPVNTSSLGSHRLPSGSPGSVEGDQGGEGDLDSPAARPGRMVVDVEDTDGARFERKLTNVLNTSYAETPRGRSERRGSRRGSSEAHAVPVPSMP
eukprot:Hpha_TRINITY_DN14001_c0_g4::TRINITY_DN14001_c0_g4_i1::g.43961::m.43961